MGRELRTKPSVSAGIIKDIRSGGIRHIEYAPGNGTQYSMLLVPCVGLEIGGTYTAQETSADRGKTFTTVVLLNGTHRAYPFSEVPHWAYIGEKLGMGATDAMVLEELFKYLLTGEDTVGVPKED